MLSSRWKAQFSGFKTWYIYFYALLAILRMFKFIPIEFVSLFKQSPVWFEHIGKL